VKEYSGHCQCRKLSPFFLLEARDRLGRDLEKSWMLGDRSSDFECGAAAGTRTIRGVNGPEGNEVWARVPRADHVVDSLLKAADIIVARLAE
jgi:D-glycero-D-manno-heptose 1,7-bisphosphate phosphatase